eukprot:6211269-Pleurochrysis_carterae.AAC.3
MPFCSRERACRRLRAYGTFLQISSLLLMSSAVAVGGGGRRSPAQKKLDRVEWADFGVVGEQSMGDESSIAQVHPRYALERCGLGFLASPAWRSCVVTALDLLRFIEAHDWRRSELHAGCVDSFMAWLLPSRNKLRIRLT